MTGYVIATQEPPDDEPDRDRRQYDEDTIAEHARHNRTCDRTEKRTDGPKKLG